MDLDDFRSVLESAGVDLWTFIDTAISVASSDYGEELKHRRDGIVERLYASSKPRCWNCDGDNRNNGPNGHEMKPTSIEKQSSHEGKTGDGGGGSPLTPQSIDDGGDDDGDRDRPYGGFFDDEQMKILAIKEHLEEPGQSEESLVELLQSLADMDITFKALKETDIGRHVNRLRKHSSNEVRRMVKQLVRKWKDLVDEWVRLNTPGELASSAALIADGDSPQQKVPQNVHHQVPDFAYSPNPHNGSSGSDKNNAEHEPKRKPIPRRETPTKPAQSTHVSASAPPNKPREQKEPIMDLQKPREQKEPIMDSERLASARRRLQENYKEAENAKRQRTIQVMDIHEIPKPKNAFFPRNKGGSHGRH